jgi:uncharacterized protein with ATP-grasp and redox domains
VTPLTRGANRQVYRRRRLIVLLATAMETHFDCIPCFVRQTLEAVRFVTSDAQRQEQVLREVLRRVAEMNMRQSPPEMAQWIHRRIRELTGVKDPYAEVKEEFNRLGLQLLPILRQIIEDSAFPLETAVRIATGGNVIDLGINSGLSERHMHDAIRESLSMPLRGNIEEFADAVRSARDILYLADNAGEIVFDRLLIEQLPLTRVTLAVRGAPVLNDATMFDAESVGLTELVEVIDNGSDAPGTILADCGKVFQRSFVQADLIVAKGQGNYESLSDCDRNIRFLLKIKCPVVAEQLNCRVGEIVLRSRGSGRWKRF